MNRHEQEDRPAFERWYQDRFGQLVSTLRREEALVHEYGELIEAVQFEYHYRGGSYRAAYRRVMDRRESGEPEEETRSEGDAAEDGQADEAEAFKSFFRDVFGCDNEEAEDLFREFTGQKGQEREQASARKPGVDAESEEEESLLTRIKDRFRLLARKLHPDVQGETCDRKKELWHEAQEAYREGNLERLDTLLAVCEVEEDRVTEATGLSLLEKVRGKFRASLRALNTKLREAKKDPAWKFSRSETNGRFEARIRRDIEYRLEHTRDEREEMEALIGEWRQPMGLARKAASEGNRTAPRKKSGRKRRAEAPGQTEFSFG